VISLAQLKKLFDANFSEPFLGAGLVKTKLFKNKKGRTLEITIGRRDIWIDARGKLVAAGTDCTD
jgi:hypothetical protein